MDRSKTILAPGHDAEWTAINADEARARGEDARTASVEELLRRGQQLSAQAGRLQRAVSTR